MLHSLVICLCSCCSHIWLLGVGRFQGVGHPLMMLSIVLFPYCASLSMPNITTQTASNGNCSVAISNKSTFFIEYSIRFLRTHLFRIKKLSMAFLLTHLCTIQKMLYKFDSIFYRIFADISMKSVITKLSIQTSTTLYRIR